MSINGTSQLRKLALASALLSCSALVAPAQISAQDIAGEIAFEADDLNYFPSTREVIAKGNVLLSKDGFKLYAAEVRYDENTGIVIARGNVRMVSPNGEEISAPEITVTNALKNAFVEDVRLIMKDGSQVAALSAERDGDAGRTTLTRAVYSPCKICEDKPGDKPLWQIKAVKVTHDEGKRRMSYKNAYLELLGVPIFWVPFFSHPDSEQERASGLLPVEISHRKSLGLVVAAPYHFAISKSKDLTLTPIIPSAEEPVLAAEYRQHIGFGQFQINASGTYTGVKDYTTGITGPKEFRGHLFAKANFQHGDNWRSSLDLNTASDDTYLRLYGFSNLDTLKSEAKMEGFFDRTYVSFRVLGFQGLRVEDVAGLTPIAMPHIQVEYVPKWKPGGGTMYARFDAISVTRTQGMSTHRVSTSLEWNKYNILNNGMVLESEALVRADVYNIEDSRLPDDPAFAGVDGTHDRFLTHWSSRLSYPMVKFKGSSSQTIEPILEVTLAPNGGNPVGLSNEDSRAFELNHINLFDTDRSSGLDLWEGGTRITYGLRWTMESDELDVDIMAGQSWRRENRDDNYLIGSGLEDAVSDFVGRTNVRYKDWLTVHHRFRLDKDNLRVKRNEASVTVGTNKARANFGYLRLNRDLNFINREDREELRFTGHYSINENWTVRGNAITNLTSGADNIEYGIGLNYLDECFDFGIEWQKRFTSDRDIVPGTSIMLRLKLKNLG